MKTVTLTFEPSTRAQAFQARVARGLNAIDDRDTFFGPVFNSVKIVVEEGEWLKVVLTDDTEYWYPKWQIVRVKISPTKQ